MISVSFLKKVLPSHVQKTHALEQKPLHSRISIVEAKPLLRDVSPHTAVDQLVVMFSRIGMDIEISGLVVVMTHRIHCTHEWA